MVEFLLEPQNLPFSIALAVLLIISIIEILGTLFGMGLSHLFEMVIPSIDITSGLDAKEALFGRIFSWLRIGKIPVIIVIMLFLICFSLCGFVVQYLLVSLFGYMLSGFIAGIIVLVISIPVVRFIAGGINKIIPEDDSEAVSEDSFVGKIATITLTTTDKNKPAQAVLKDNFGKMHYIMVEPDTDKESFKSNDTVIVVRREEYKFYAIKNTHESLV